MTDHEHRYMYDRAGTQATAIGRARLALSDGDPGKAADILDDAVDELHRLHWDACVADGHDPEAITRFLGPRDALCSRSRQRDRHPAVCEPSPFAEACRFVAAYESGQEPPPVSAGLARCIAALAETEDPAEWARHYLIVTRPTKTAPETEAAPPAAAGCGGVEKARAVYSEAFVVTQAVLAYLVERGPVGVPWGELSAAERAGWVEDAERVWRRG